MKFCKWLARGLGIIGLVLTGIVLSASVVSVTTERAYAQAITVSSIVVQGNQRVDADTIRSYFRPGPGGRLDAFQIDEGVKALYATGLFQDIRPSIAGRPADHHRRRKPGDQPDRLRGQQEGQGRAAQGRDPVEGTRHLVAAGGAGRRGAPGRRLSAQRPLRRPRRAQDHRAAEQPRRPRVRDQRGRQDRRQEHRVRRQSRLLVAPAQGRHQDIANRPAGVPADHRHLRSGPYRSGP